ncbi:MAG TPA: hypothetical protein VH257_12370 [Chloroflexota bacterium]|nr:hypothetical protein [Chloroflexota bacterium]
MAEPANVTVDVYVRDITVKDESDRGPGGGEFDVTIVAAATPLAAEGDRSGVQWTGSAHKGRTYDVGRWTGPVTLTARHALYVVGAGEEQDRIRNDALRGGMALLSAALEWGTGRWWRTTNGKHFDFQFYVERIEAGGSGDLSDAPAQAAGSADAPGPAQPTEAEYSAAFGAPL